jgi:ATP diphosphatase
VIDKIQEEAAELVEARDEKTPEDVFEEYGDLMFVMVNLGRHLGLESEEALRAANKKFIRRFNDVEKSLNDIGMSPKDSDLAEMDRLWDIAKARDKAGKL